MTKDLISNSLQPILKRADKLYSFYWSYIRANPGAIILIDDCSPLNRTGKNFEAFGYATHFIQQRYLVKIDQIGNFFVGMKPLDAAPIKIDYDQIKTLQAKMAVFAGSGRFEFL